VQPLLKHLLDLQNVDVNLIDVRARLAQFPKRLAELDARVAAARGEIETSKAAHLTALKDRKKYELDVEQWKEKAKKYKEQAYQVKTNEAFKALQHEAQMAEEEIAKAEDRLLEQMVAGEEYDRRIKSSEKILKEVEVVTRTEREKVEADRAVAEKERAKYEAERAVAIGAIPEDLLDHYDRIARKHGGTALAEVRSEMCGACGVRVRPHVFQEMRRAGNEQIYHCETCTRMLYYIEPPSPPAPPAAEGDKVPSSAPPSES
jgi:predicted  nucleic acid-binding Zn-ribbon protein